MILKMNYLYSQRTCNTKSSCSDPLSSKSLLVQPYPTRSPGLASPGSASSLHASWASPFPNGIENCRHFLEGKQENCPRNQVIFKCQKHPVREPRLSKSAGTWRSDKPWFTTLEVTWKQSVGGTGGHLKQPETASHPPRQAQHLPFSHL